MMNEKAVEFKIKEADKSNVVVVSERLWKENCF